MRHNCPSAPKPVYETRPIYEIGPIYEIRVRGHLDKDYWAQWFEGMAVRADANGETVLTGPVADQAALFGLLTRIRDLALPLVSVHLVTK